MSHFGDVCSKDPDGRRGEISDLQRTRYLENLLNFLWNLRKLSHPQSFTERRVSSSPRKPFSETQIFATRSLSLDCCLSQSTQLATLKCSLHTKNWYDPIDFGQWKNSEGSTTTKRVHFCKQILHYFGLKNRKNLFLVILGTFLPKKPRI